jgi:FixJ family two-component response regulator
MHAMCAPVAILDDEPALRRSLARLLRAAGYEAREYATGLELLEALVAERFACIILDLQMPRMSGLDVQAGTAFRRAGVPTIVISARDETALQQACMEAGALAYLAKPVDDDALLDAVQAACAMAATHG